VEASDASVEKKGDGSDAELDHEETLLNISDDAPSTQNIN